MACVSLIQSCNVHAVEIPRFIDLVGSCQFSRRGSGPNPKRLYRSQAAAKGQILRQEFNTSLASDREGEKARRSHQRGTAAVKPAVPCTILIRAFRGGWRAIPHPKRRGDTIQMETCCGQLVPAARTVVRKKAGAGSKSPSMHHPPLCAPNDSSVRRGWSEV